MPFLAVYQIQVVESNHSLKLIYDFTVAISNSFIVYLGFLSLGIVIFSNFQNNYAICSE
jgi:hypothetical protein